MWFVHLPDVDLAYLPQGIKEFDEYVEAVSGHSTSPWSTEKS